MGRLDPCAVEYGGETPGAAQVEEQEEQVDVEVERGSADWQEIQPHPATAPASLMFVDGVRRIESRLLVSRDAQFVHGAIGSYSVGAGRVSDGLARFAAQEHGRVVIFGCGVLPGDALTLGTGPVKEASVRPPQRDQIVALDKEIRSFEQLEASTRDRLAELEPRIASREVDEASLTAAAAWDTAASRAAEEAVAAAARLGEQVQKLRNDVERARTLASERAAISRTLATTSEMASDRRNDAFQVLHASGAIRMDSLFIDEGHRRGLRHTG